MRTFILEWKPSISSSDTEKRVLRNHLNILLSEAEEHADKALEVEVRQALTIVQI